MDFYLKNADVKHFGMVGFYCTSLYDQEEAGAVIRIRSNSILQGNMINVSYNFIEIIQYFKSGD